jgi:methylmalonyl-CoA/ethylmalonyl-CoA epimerase
VASTPKGWKFAHVGFVVGDMDKATQRFQSMGLGPFSPLGRGSPPKRRTYLGKEVPPANFGFNIRVGKMGDTIGELVESVKGETIQKQFLDSSGEGINHIAFEVEDIQAARAIMEKLGYRVKQNSKFENGEICLFFDSDNGNLVIELIQPPKAGK